MLIRITERTGVQLNSDDSRNAAGTIEIIEYRTRNNELRGGVRLPTSDFSPIFAH